MHRKFYPNLIQSFSETILLQEMVNNLNLIKSLSHVILHVKLHLLYHDLYYKDAYVICLKHLE